MPPSPQLDTVMASVYLGEDTLPERAMNGLCEPRPYQIREAINKMVGTSGYC